MEDYEAIVHKIDDARQFLHGCEMTHYLDDERIELFRMALDALMREIDREREENSI